MSSSFKGICDMPKYLFANNDTTTLASSINSTVTSASLAAGTGGLFPSPSAGQVFTMTFIDAATGENNEIVYVTARVGDVITMERGQEGTSAQSWAAGDIAANLITAGALGSLVQEVDILKQAGQFAVDGGTANAVDISLSPAITSLNDILGSPIRILKIASPNTGAMTITVNGLTAPLVNATAGDPMWNGELQAETTFTVVYGGSEFSLQSLPAPIDINLGTSNVLFMARLMASSHLPNGAISTMYNGNGNPNGVVAGTAQTTGAPPDTYWDYTGQALWVCTTTGSTSGAVWQPANRSVVPIANSQVISAGSFSIAVPGGASVADITANGAGGGGGGGTDSNGGAAGGGGGGYFHWQVPVNGGSITGTVGAGGAGGNDITDGANGGATTVVYTSNTRIAGGGSGGHTASGDTTFAVAGGGVTGTGFVTALAGYPSFGGVQGYTGSSVLYYGGTGGTSPNGGHGGAANITAPDAGGFPGGGGGGGAANSSVGQTGGAGMDGQVSINFF